MSNTWKINQNKNISSTSQSSTKQHIFTSVTVKCLFIVQFSKLKLLHKGGKLLDTSRLKMLSNYRCPNMITKLLIMSSDVNPNCNGYSKCWILSQPFSPCRY